MDLHIHTIYSDRADDIITILNKAQKLGLKYLSITDHDCCKAYLDLKNMDISKYFSGDIIPGIEITVSFNNQRIDILAYNFDNIDVINDYFQKVKNIDWASIKLKLRKDFLYKLDKLNLKYDDKFKDEKFQSEFLKYETLLYASLLELNPNLKEIIKEDYCESPNDFFRKCICNPNSEFFINFIQYYPKLKDSINFIHENGGICFLAHPFEYRAAQPEKFIKSIYDYCEENNCKLDGIETHYSTFTNEQIDYLKKFAKERNILISGGSDYHGAKRENFDVGKYLNQKEIIPNQIIDNWPTLKLINKKL